MIGAFRHVDLKKHKKLNSEYFQSKEGLVLLKKMIETDHLYRKYGDQLLTEK